MNREPDLREVREVEEVTRKVKEEILREKRARSETKARRRRVHPGRDDD